MFNFFDPKNNRVNSHMDLIRIRLIIIKLSDMLIKMGNDIKKINDENNNRKKL